MNSVSARRSSVCYFIIRYESLPVPTSLTTSPYKSHYQSLRVSLPVPTSLTTSPYESTGWGPWGVLREHRHTPWLSGLENLKWTNEINCFLFLWFSYVNHGFVPGYRAGPGDAPMIVSEGHRLPPGVCKGPPGATVQDLGPSGMQDPRWGGGAWEGPHYYYYYYYVCVWGFYDGQDATTPNQKGESHRFSLSTFSQK